MTSAVLAINPTLHWQGSPSIEQTIPSRTNYSFLLSASHINLTTNDTYNITSNLSNPNIQLIFNQTEINVTNGTESSWNITLNATNQNATIIEKIVFNITSLADNSSYSFDLSLYVFNSTTSGLTSYGNPVISFNTTEIVQSGNDDQTFTYSVLTSVSSAGPGEQKIASNCNWTLQRFGGNGNLLPFLTTSSTNFTVSAASSVTSNITLTNIIAGQYNNEYLSLRCSAVTGMEGVVPTVKPPKAIQLTFTVGSSPAPAGSGGGGGSSLPPPKPADLQFNPTKLTFTYGSFPKMLSRNSIITNPEGGEFVGTVVVSENLKKLVNAKYCDFGNRCFTDNFRIASGSTGFLVVDFFVTEDGGCSPVEGKITLHSNTKDFDLIAVVDRTPLCSVYTGISKKLGISVKNSVSLLFVVSGVLVIALLFAVTIG